VVNLNLSVERADGGREERWVELENKIELEFI
jgi:hypothetical protein